MNERIIDSLFESQEYEQQQLFADGQEIEGATSIELPISPCEARIVKWIKGSTIPQHYHSSETYKFILRGKVENEEGEILTAGADYKCGGWEYGPWWVREDTYILVLSSPNTTTHLGPNPQQEG